MTLLKITIGEGREKIMLKKKTAVLLFERVFCMKNKIEQRKNKCRVAMDRKK